MLSIIDLRRIETPPIILDPQLNMVVKVGEGHNHLAWGGVFDRVGQRLLRGAV